MSMNVNYAVARFVKVPTPTHSPVLRRRLHLRYYCEIINDTEVYSQTCVKRPYKTRHIFGFSDGWLLIAELSALLSFSNKQLHVYSNFYVT